MEPHDHAPAIGHSPVPSALRWSVGPTLVFGAMLATLLTMALWARWSPVTRPSGMPDDPDVRVAHAILNGELPLAARGLVLVSAFAGESPDADPDSLPLARLAAAHGRLAAAAGRHPDDVRLATTLAHLELASARFETAERAYREVLVRAPHHGEARLGLGIALAMRGAWESPAGMSEPGRGLALQSLAQFANVDGADPAYWAAVYDRAMMARTLGRGVEGRLAIDEAVRRGAPPGWVARYQALLVTTRR